MPRTINNFYEIEKQAKETVPDSPLQKKILKFILGSIAVITWGTISYQIVLGLCKLGGN